MASKTNTAAAEAVDFNAPEPEEAGTDFSNEPVDLADLDPEWEEATLDDENVPDGKYQVMVDRVEITKAKQSGNTLLKWYLKILGPTHAGRMLFRNNVLMSGENVKYLKRDLARCGLKLERASELPSHLEDLLGVVLQVTVKTNGEFQNVYIDRQVSGIQAAASDGETLSAF